jgi:hypothetical protein
MYLLPTPQECSFNNERFILRYDTKIILDSTLEFQEKYYAEILQKQIENSLGFYLTITRSYYIIDKVIYLTISDKLKSQEYSIDIHENQIILTGGSSPALLYAVQTLRQIIIQQGAVLDGLHIFDYPGIKTRGFYHDITRGRIPTLKTLMELADKISFYKLNQLQLYIEHSFLLEGFSEIWRDDTPITAEEILKLDEYCRRLNIELVPSVASFGHLHKILSSKTYSELCELCDSDKESFSFVSRMQHHTVDVTNDKSYTIITNMLLQFLPLFSSNKFNICADETFDLGIGKSSERAKQVGTHHLYTDFLKRLCEFVKNHGKQPMFWGDILLSNPVSIRELPKDSICLNWDYSPQAEENNFKKLYDLGVKQYVCPGVHGWRRMMNDLKTSYDNITALSNYAHKYSVEGFLITDWGDYGHINHPEFSTTGMIYGAAFSWNNIQLDYEEINKRISALEYLDRSQSLIAVLDRMAQQDHALWEKLVEYKESSQENIEKQKEEEYFRYIDIMQLETSNTELRFAEEEMYQIISSMDSLTRHRVKAYLVAAKGIRLFNTLAILIGQYTYQISGLSSYDPAVIAVKLEYWFKDYKEIWRKQYKESELYRIQEVIFWYADWLRDICK